MKKQIMFMAMTAMLIASCSSDDVVSTNTGRAIDFRTSVGTRGTETTTTNIDKFWVTAIDEAGANYFSKQEFTKDDGVFTSSPLYYWPAGTLNFFAYSPSETDLGATVTINKNTKTLADFSPAAKIADQKDFVTATGTRADNEPKGVKLTFAHQLSQIEIKAKNTNTGYIYKVVGVRIGKPVSKGTFTMGTTSSSWALTTTVKTNYSVEYTTPPRTLAAEAATMMGTANDNAMLLPQQLVAWTSATDPTNNANGAYIALKIQITTKDGARVYPAKGDYDWAAVAIGTNWEAGKKYVYTLDFSNGAGKVDPEKKKPVDPTDPFNPGEDILGKPIKFTVTVTPWVPADQPVEM